MAVNKHGAFIRSQLGEEQWSRLTAGRTTILLLGDSLGDSHMADGLEGYDVVRLGFLNETDEARVAPRLPQYEAVFDAVLLHDQSFEWLLRVLGF